jgi:hypothetical protein
MERVVHTSKGKVSLWEHPQKLPREIGDLSPLFQQVFGWKDVRGEDKVTFQFEFLFFRFGRVTD